MPAMTSRGLVLGGLLWQPALAAEKIGHPHAGSAGWYLDQGVFFCASLALLTGFVGLDRSGVAGRSRSGRIAGRLIVGAWALVTLGGALQLARVGSASDVVTGIGGLLGYVAALVFGVVVARARVLTGWRRWMPLAQAAYLVLVVLLPVIVLNSDGPVWPVESLWQLGWAGVGMAVLTAKPWGWSAGEPSDSTIAERTGRSVEATTRPSVSKSWQR